MNGNVGVISRRPYGRLLSALGFTIATGKIVEIHSLADPVGVYRLDLAAVRD